MDSNGIMLSKFQWQVHLLGEAPTTPFCFSFCSTSLDDERVGMEGVKYLKETGLLLRSHPCQHENGALFTSIPEWISGAKKPPEIGRLFFTVSFSLSQGAKIDQSSGTCSRSFPPSNLEFDGTGGGCSWEILVWILLPFVCPRSVHTLTHTR